MTDPSGLGNDPLQLVDLSLRAAEGSELLVKQFVSPNKLRIWRGEAEETYPLLGELTRTLIFAVAEQFNHALLIGSKSSLGEVWLARYIPRDTGKEQQKHTQRLP